MKECNEIDGLHFSLACPDAWNERCGDGACIVRTQVCNGHVMCMDDESNCSE